MTSRHKITWFFLLVVLWMSGSLFITLHEYFFLANYPGVTEVEQMTSYSFSGSLIAAVVWGVMAGPIFSALELFYFSGRDSERSSSPSFYELIGKMVLRGKSSAINAFTVLLNPSLRFREKLFPGNGSAFNGRVLGCLQDLHDHEVVFET